MSLALLLCIDIRSKWSFKLQQLPQSTSRETDSRLRLIESIKTRFHGVSQTVHISLRVEILPRPCADLTAAAFEGQEQSVQSLLEAVRFPVV
jgi:hypothetical protein